VTVAKEYLTTVGSRSYQRLSIYRQELREKTYSICKGKTRLK